MHLFVRKAKVTPALADGLTKARQGYTKSRDTDLIEQFMRSQKEFTEVVHARFSLTITSLLLPSGAVLDIVALPHTSNHQKYMPT